MPSPTNATSTNGEDSTSRELNPLSLVNVVLRRRRLVVLAVLVIELALLIVALRRPIHYTTTVAFMPEGQRPASGVSGLAAQFGVNMNASDGLSAPLFFQELVKSPQFLAAVADSQYETASGVKRSLVDIYDFNAADARVRRARAVERLNRDVVVSVAPRTGIVTISVKADSPNLARDIAARILTEITRFNQQTRQSRAAAEKRFVEMRLADVRDSLRAAEDRLNAFLLENRDYRTSPTLAFRYARLERDVQSQQMLLTTLGPSYEQAKIEQVRDTPVLTILRRPEAPVYADPRGRLRLMITGLIAALGLGAGLALGLEGWRHLRSAPDPVSAEFSSLTSDIGSQVRQRHFVRALFGPGNGQRS